MLSPECSPQTVSQENIDFVVGRLASVMVGQDKRSLYLLADKYTEHDLASNTEHFRSFVKEGSIVVTYFLDSEVFGYIFFRLSLK